MALALTALGCRGPMAKIPAPRGFLAREVTVAGRTFPYVVYVPRQWRPGERWPVILFLHGAGERGSDGWRQTAVGLGSALRWHPERIPAIVVMPQAPAGERWLGPPADAAYAALERTLAEVGGDEDRVYLTGLSMGGYGVWHLALAHPRRWAALVPICGGLLPHETTSSVARSPLTAGFADPYAGTAERLAHLPIWIVHGAADPVVPVEESRQMAAALEAAGAAVRYDELPGVGHDAWDPAYGDPELWRWLFAQGRATR